MAKRPVHEVKYALIKARVWQNQTKSGERFSVEIIRLFKDGDQWRESHRFGRNDLQLVSKVADLVHTWIYEQGNVNQGSTTTERSQH